MKLKFAVLLVFLAAPSFGDTVTPETCPLTGPLKAATEDCQARRLAFRGALQDCMDRREKAAKERVGGLLPGSSQSRRSMFLICDAETRKSMEVASK